MTFAVAISKITTPLVLGLLYFLVITPAGIVMRLSGKLPTVRRERSGSFWISSADAGIGPHSDLERQF